MHLGGLIRRVCHSQWTANELYMLVLVLLLLLLPQRAKRKLLLVPSAQSCAAVPLRCFGGQGKGMNDMAARELKITLGRFDPRAGSRSVLSRRIWISR